MTGFFDTHAHYDDSRFDQDREEILSSMPQMGVELILNAASDLESAKKSLLMAQKYPFIYAAAGVHPHEAKEVPQNYLDEIERLAAQDRVVALGEMGLDYHYDFSPRDVQERIFREQLDLARSLDMPVIIHEREAAQDCLEIVRDFSVRGVFHCYSGSVETARELVKRGFYLSFGGAVTFKNARRALEVIKDMPIDRLLLETDCPYMTPEPFRGRRNHSGLLVHVAQKIAELRGITPDEAIAVTAQNGKALFFNK